MSPLGFSGVLASGGAKESLLRVLVARGGSAFAARAAGSKRRSSALALRSAAAAPERAIRPNTHLVAACATFAPTIGAPMPSGEATLVAAEKIAPWVSDSMSPLGRAAP